MKPKTTWVAVANARLARVLVHAGAGQGLQAQSKMTLHAVEAPKPQDKAGVGHSIAGPARNAVEQKGEQEQAERDFAQTIADALFHAQQREEFDRLIIVAGPHMLGVLRTFLAPDVVQRVIGEIAKDLTHVSTEAIGEHLGDLIYV